MKNYNKYKYNKYKYNNNFIDRFILSDTYIDKMYNNIMQTECCICLNNINDKDIFTLECCNNLVHHECIIEWINSSIDNSFVEYNKCILCRSFNTTINDIYHDLLRERNNSQINIVIDNNQNNTGTIIIFDSYQYRFDIIRKIITCCSRIIFITITLFSCYLVLDIMIKIEHL